MKLNTYIAHFKNGGQLMLSASNMSGAKAQTRLLAPYLSYIERVYKSGEKALPPFEGGKTNAEI